MADSNPLSLIIAIKFIDLLATDFSEWEAYKLGLIDINGKKIRSPSGPLEKKYFKSWYNLVRNIKRSLQKVPGGKSKFASYATAFALLREDLGSDVRIEQMIVEALDPNGERFLSESEEKTCNQPLDAGRYFIMEGVSKLMLEEQGSSPIFSAAILEPQFTPFGPVYRHIDSNRRIYVCRHQIARL